MSEKFNYTREWTDAEAFPLLGFTRDWNNPDDYPTIEVDEKKVRQDMQSLHDEVKDYLNNELIPRVVAEEATVAAWQAQEDAHAEAETARAVSEQERVNAEQGRVNAENSRANAEQTRVNAEQGRVSAENARVAAEQARVDVNTGIVAQATTQANAAKQSADNAENFKVAAETSATSASGSASAASTSATNAAGSASAAANSATAANASKNAAKASEDNAKYWAEQAQGASGGDFATRTEAQNYANTAESNANTYTDQKIAAIPAPDVSGQINTHNTDTAAHSDIRQLIANKKGAQVYTATIGTSWTENSETGVKTQTVSISGVTADNTAKVDHSSASVNGTSDGYAVFVEEENQYLEFITNGFAETVANGIKFTIFGDPNTVPIPIVVEVV